MQNNTRLIVAMQALAELNLGNPRIKWPTPEQVLERAQSQKDIVLLGIGTLRDNSTGITVPVRAIVATETDILLLRVSAYIEASLVSIHCMDVQLSIGFVEAEYAALIEQGVIDEDDAEQVWPY